MERLDTRSMTLHVRDHGAQRLLITPDCDSSTKDLMKRFDDIPHMVGSNLAQTVTASENYLWNAYQQQPTSIAYLRIKPH